MEELLLVITRALVDFPDQVKVVEIKGSVTAVFEIHVAPGECGKIIGKQGQTAKAIRVILNAVATKEKKRAVLEIVEQ